MAVKVTSENAIRAKATSINWGLLSANFRFLNFSEINGTSDTSIKLMPIAIKARI
jgi:hypothetical protein